MKVAADTPDGCPELHHAFEQPEKVLYRFLEKDRGLGQIPCVRAQVMPALAAGALTCTVRHRPVDFLRFPSSTVAGNYFSAMRNKQAVPVSAGRCLADAKTWNVYEIEEGPLAFLRRRHKFLILWGYWTLGSQNIGVIRGPMDEAADICRYWEEEAF